MATGTVVKAVATGTADEGGDSDSGGGKHDAPEMAGGGFRPAARDAVLAVADAASDLAGRAAG